MSGKSGGRCRSLGGGESHRYMEPVDQIVRYSGRDSEKHGFLEQAQMGDGNVQSTLILAEPGDQTNEISEELERKKSLLKIQEIRMGKIDLDHMFE